MRLYFGLRGLVGAMVTSGALLSGGAVAAQDSGADAARASAYGPQMHAPAVIELYTSQSCAACPPADALLAGLRGRDDVLPLSFHVDYWDYLGWNDMFARPEFTNRQKRYAYRDRARAIYTPQIIVNGMDSPQELRPADLMDLVAAHRAHPAVVRLSAKTSATDTGAKDHHVTLSLVPPENDPPHDSPPTPRPALVLLVDYLPERAVTMKEGENRGKTVVYYNIVTDLRAIAEWDGQTPLRLGMHFRPVDHQEIRHAVLVQERAGPDGTLPGAVLAALRLD